MHIRKVKSTNGLILIRAEEASGEDDIRRIELESRAEPRPEFHEAMGDLIAPAMRMIQAPSAWIAVATISGVSISHEEERGMGAAVTLLVPLECAPSPLVINTPYLTSIDPKESRAPVLPTDLCHAVIRVVDEATRYLRGDRAQGDLFAGRSDDEPVDNPFDGMSVYRQLTGHKVAEHDADGVVEELGPAAEHIMTNVRATRAALQAGENLTEHEPAEYVAGKQVVGAEPEYVGAPKGPVIKPARGRRAVS